MDERELAEQMRQLDDEFAEYFGRRLAVAKQLVERRLAKGEEPFAWQEEDARCERAASHFAAPFEREAVKESLSQLMTVERKGQYERIKDYMRVPDEFCPVDHLETEGARVIFQGVEGAYSHQAMRRFFGCEARAEAVPTFEAAMAAIERGDADYGVLPIENTTGGAVGDVLDLQMKYDCYTVAELDLPIRHVLLGLPGAKLEEITDVCSHPQGLMQCSRFLEEHREWGRIPMSNTAASAKRLVSQGDPHYAAIASELAGELYGLEVLARDISNDAGNTTRFIIVTRKKIFKKDAGKIRVCFECRHSTGMLYRLLSNFTFNALNMTKIESRPIPGHNWEYRFFVEFEGNLLDANVQNAIWGIKQEANVCRILGNFTMKDPASAQP